MSDRFQCVLFVPFPGKISCYSWLPVLCGLGASSRLCVGFLFAPPAVTDPLCRGWSGSRPASDFRPIATIAARLDTPPFTGKLSRSVGSWDTRLPMIATSHQESKARIYETTISTVENPPQTAARISQPQLEQEWARHPAQPPPHGAQAADAGLITAHGRGDATAPGAGTRDAD